jgi:hypothetical protein
MQELLDSIRHWEENVGKARRGELTHDDIRSSSCPLCKKFYQSCRDNDRNKCPVFKAGFKHCVGDKITLHTSTWTDVRASLYNGPVVINNCQREVDFLKSLLVTEG